MSTYSLANLLEWMRAPDTNVLWRWSAIAAMTRDKTNLILLQEYITRFGSDRYLPPINGAVELVGGYVQETLHDFQLDIPRLSFENADLNRSKAKLSMALVGGVQLSQRKGVDNWYIFRVIENDPLLGPWLSLDLNLQDVPGNVGSEGGKVSLDLSKSSDFRLAFGPGEYEQLRGGEAIRLMFEDLDDEQRVFVLGSIQPGSDSLLRPQSFKLRTMSKGSVPDTGDGALLIQIRAQGSQEGDLVGQSFRYPIPNDAGKDYSATVLLDGPLMKKRLPLVEQLLESLNHLITEGQFTTHNNADGLMDSAKARLGNLWFDIAKSTLGPFPFYGKHITVTSYRMEVALPANSVTPLSLQLEANGRVSILWKTSGVVAYLSQIKSDKPGAVYPDSMTAFRYDVNLSGLYDVVESGNDVVLKPVEWKLDIQDEQITTSEQPATQGSESESEWEWLMLIAIIADQLLQLSRLMIGPRLEQALNRDFKVEVPLGSFIKDCIKLNFGQAIETDVLALPRDVGAFGRISPMHSTFVISPLQPLLLAGGAQQFITAPRVAGLVWTAEDLLRSSADSGTFIANGYYRAPAAGSFRGRFLRVRITATDPVTGYGSSALVTVVANGLVVNPLFYECGFEDEFELTAGLLGAGTLRWSIKRPVDGESGSIEPNGPLGATYRTALSRPRKTYVLDEIEVANLSTGQRQSVHVLVLMWAPTVTVVVVPDPSLGQGQVRLQAWAAGQLCDITEWDLLQGPGLISADGIYTMNYASPERFALITVVANISDPDWYLGEGDGHIVLPLPLADFAAQLTAFARDPSAV